MSVVTRGRSQQAAVAAASPGAVSQLGEQLAGLGLADQAAPAAAVAWAVALKPPQSGAVLVVDGAAEGGGAWREEGDGCAWLVSKLLKQVPSCWLQTLLLPHQWLPCNVVSFPSPVRLN
jgi:hypothetical protein